MRRLRHEGRDLTLVIEPINTRDIPGFFLNRQDDAHALVDEIVAAYQTSEGRDLARSALKAEARGKAPAAIVDSAVTELGAVSALVAAKAPEAAPGFKAWLNEIAAKVAEAGSEGGFLGFGGEKVSAAEKATLERIATTLA